MLLTPVLEQHSQPQALVLALVPPLTHLVLRLPNRNLQLLVSEETLPPLDSEDLAQPNNLKPLEDSLVPRKTNQQDLVELLELLRRLHLLELPHPPLEHLVKQTLPDPSLMPILKTSHLVQVLEQHQVALAPGLEQILQPKDILVLAKTLVLI